MNPFPRIAAGLLVAALGACASTPPAEPDAANVAADEAAAAAAEATASACDASQAQSLIGTIASDAVQEQARTAAGASIARTLKPNQPTTREYRAERLNLHVDDAGRIVSANCG